jgi:hypothetical protein
MKAAAAQRAGDTATAAQALEALYGKASGAEQGQVAEQLASTYASATRQRQGGAMGAEGPGRRQQQRHAEAVAGLPAGQQW